MLNSKTNIIVCLIYIFRNLEERDHLKYGMVLEIYEKA